MWWNRRRSQEYQIAQGMKDIDSELRYWMQERDRAREDLENGRKMTDRNRIQRAEQRLRRIDERCRTINEVLAFLQEAKDNIRFQEGTVQKAVEVGRLAGSGDNSDKLKQLIQNVSEQMQYTKRSQEKIESQMALALEMARSSLPEASSETTAPVGPTPEQIEREQQELEKRLRRSRRLA